MSVRQPVAFALILWLAAFCVTGCSDAGLPAPSTSDVAAERSDAPSISIQVAPAILILGSPGTWVTVHAEIAYSEVGSGTVTLNGIVPESTFPDSRGEFVAKFDRESVEAIASPPEVTLTLDGLTSSGIPFSGSETIAVK
jgi:hypothetical protein